MGTEKSAQISPSPFVFSHLCTLVIDNPSPISRISVSNLSFSVIISIKESQFMNGLYPIVLTFFDIVIFGNFLHSSNDPYPISSKESDNETSVAYSQ